MLNSKWLLPLFFFFFLGLGQIKASSNCGCDSVASFEAAYEKANIIFVGVCMDVVSNPIKGGLNILFQVDSSWKRGIEKVATVHTNSSNQCGYKFERNEKYIVFANKRHQTISTSECEPNELLSANSQLTFAKLGPGIAPGRPELARNLAVLLSGLVLASMIFVAFVVLRKKFKKSVKINYMCLEIPPKYVFTGSFCTWLVVENPHCPWKFL